MPPKKISSQSFVNGKETSRQVFDKDKFKKAQQLVATRGQRVTRPSKKVSDQKRTLNMGPGPQAAQGQPQPQANQSLVTGEQIAAEAPNPFETISEQEEKSLMDRIKNIVFDPNFLETGKPKFDLGRAVEGTAATVGLLSGAGVVSSLLKKGGTQVASRGALSKVAEAASGILRKPKIGTGGLLNTAGRVSTNTKTAKQTQSFISRLVASAKANPGTTTIAAGASVLSVAKFVNEMVGTYNFAGFIEEEALQTVGFVTSGSVKAMEDDLKFNGGANLNLEDIELTQENLDFEYSVLEPAVWSGIIDATPQKRTKDALGTFNKAGLAAADNKQRRLDEIKRQLDEIKRQVAE